MENVKFAGYVGNKHLSIRVTPFFNSAAEVTGNFEWIAECANWEEHMKWNKERAGNYASCPVEE